MKEENFKKKESNEFGKLKSSEEDAVLFSLKLIAQMCDGQFADLQVRISNFY